MRKLLSLFTVLLGLILIMGSVSSVANSPPDSDDQITITTDIVQETVQPADFKSVVETSPEITIKTVKDQASPDDEHSAVMLNNFIRPVDSRLLANDLKPVKYVHGNRNLQNPFYPLE